MDENKKVLTLSEQKEKFLEICRREIKREGLEELIAWLEKSDFFTAPASSKFHGDYTGGLCEHSLNVYEVACHLNDYYLQSAVSGESAIRLARKVTSNWWMRMSFSCFSASKYAICFCRFIASPSFSSICS